MVKVDNQVAGRNIEITPATKNLLCDLSWEGVDILPKILV